MENLLWGIALIVIGGLGSISFTHPPLSRKISYGLMTFTVVTFALLIIYNFGKINAFNRAAEIPLPMKGYEQITKHDLNLLQFTSPNQFDSLNEVFQKEREMMFYDARANTFEDKLKIDIKNAILGSSAHVKSHIQTLLLYLGVIVGILGTIIILSFLFERFHERNNKPTNKSKKSTS